MIRTKRMAISLLLAFSLLFGYMCFINVESSNAATKKIHLKKTSISLAVKKTYQQKLIDKKGKTIKATKVKWASKKKAVAKINKKGKITAVKAGTAKMTAKYKGKTYKFTVKVKIIPVSSISGTNSSVTLGVGDSKKISLTIKPSNATNKKCTWKSSDDSIVAVDQNGVVTGKQMGWVDITATAHNGKSTSIRVRVEKLWFENSEYTVNVGESIKIKLYGNVLLGLNVSYYSYYTDIELEYDSDESCHIVTIVGEKAGDTSITAFDKNYQENSVKAIANIHVVPTPESINETTKRIHDLIIQNGKETKSGDGITGDYYIESRSTPTSSTNRIVFSAFVDYPYVYMYSKNTESTDYCLMFGDPEEPEGIDGFRISAATLFGTSYWGDIIVKDYAGGYYGTETGLSGIRKSGPVDVTDTTELYKVYRRVASAMREIDAYLQTITDMSLTDLGYVNFK